MIKLQIVHKALTTTGYYRCGLIGVIICSRDYDGGIKARVGTYSFRITEISKHSLCCLIRPGLPFLQVLIGWQLKG